MIKTGIVGATGYAGSELVRLCITIRRSISGSLHPTAVKGSIFRCPSSFPGLVNIELQPAFKSTGRGSGCYFPGAPARRFHGYVEKYEGAGFRMIDLSGRFSFVGTRCTVPPGIPKHSYPKVLMGRYMVSGATPGRDLRFRLVIIPAATRPAPFWYHGAFSESQYHHPGKGRYRLPNRGDRRRR